ncbi:hypothetical protein MNBD_GAMMA26-2338 [hydrothermal vent metagenome]|uniref:Uncharacterized protein n=1 Tax=hydrothermal vent metagenome TaxID=652676 RepID=A0A3B1B7I2_9ZZZZ
MPVGRKVRQPKIIQPGRGRRWRYLVVVLVPVMVLAAAWYAFDYGRNSVEFNSAVAKQKILELEQQAAELEQQVNSLEAERTKLREQVAALGRASQIDREAARVVGEEIKIIQDDHLEMEEELVFLRGIVSSKENRKNLRVRDFKIEPTENKTVFRYSFTVSQVLTNKDDVKGTIFITLSGKENDKETSLSLEALTEKKISSIEMQFKYFQKFDGQLILPLDFKVDNMVIDVKPVNGKLSRLTETFDWLVEEE